MADDRTETLPPPTPRPAMPVVEYSTPAAGNVNASRALVWALLGFLPFIPGLMAVRYARRGLTDAEADPRIGGQGKARAAKVIGAVSICVWLVIAVAAVPVTMKARRQAQRVQCASQLRQIAIATMMYATANRGFVPPSLDELVAGKFLPASVLVCPATIGDATKPPASSGAYGNYGYVYLGGGQLISKVRNPSSQPLAYEPATNHADGGVNVAYFDGHVDFRSAAQVAAMIQQFAPPATQPATQSAPARQPNPASPSPPS
jgi:prepilin-type processing-associated H-X9-DG protein